MIIAAALAMAVPTATAPQTEPAVCLEALESPEGVAYLKNGPDYAGAYWNGKYAQAAKEGERLRAAFKARWRAKGAHLDPVALDETCEAVITSWVLGVLHQLGQTKLIVK